MDRKKSLCKFCNNQYGKYICPRCKQQYCSLTCYQCQAHLGCSEFFYKNSVEQEIKNRKVTKEEKNKILKLLLKFKYDQENAENLEFFYNNDELLEKELEQSDLKERMKDIDLESASFEEIWERLNSNEREEFVHLALRQK
ncbi:uncharacterized protein T551_01194 [Pneumocystis jirovecii RU7]|uniref:HIT-type domain-containing protein n=1 Tax=Pneumocystis jirovecii (strain RU7) TaxID=1408657 RepID=A0A0W4ZRW1_PNEJ7|nr:uncharacterized protein T551_01194 [Pneumocystis jirovecii RU7]KTW31121.1 hypothetical protein T551_01194 [Pneumocystis jirovecii RU7]